MPKIYSDFEKQHIRKRLKEEAANCMSLYGIKKTTVDELVKRVKIPKGTFYLFYENKEVLFFEVLIELHEAVEDKFRTTLQEHKGEVSVDCLTDWITQMYLDTNNLSMLKVMETGDWELLMRKLPEEVIAEHTDHDYDLILMLAQVVPEIKKKDLESFVAALRAVFILLVYQREIGAKDFTSVLRLTIRGIVLQLLEK
jgi:AcrR family transcriptional regulator